VHVIQDQSLYGIAIYELGAYNPKNTKVIQQLNPWLTDPDHIRAGQEIRIPESDLNKEETMEITKSSPEAQKP
jgi:hypothetical protein